jgi:hypothetical protein
MSSSPKVQDGAWRGAPVAERADAPVAAAASAGPSYVVTIEDKESKEQAKQRTEEEQGKKTDVCCCACCAVCVKYQHSKGRVYSMVAERARKGVAMLWARHVLLALAELVDEVAKTL